MATFKIDSGLSKKHTEEGICGRGMATVNLNSGLKYPLNFI